MSNSIYLHQVTIHKLVIYWCSKNYLLFSQQPLRISVKFYTLMRLSYLHFTAKQHLVICSITSKTRIFRHDHLAVFAWRKTFVPKVSLKQHSEQFLWRWTVAVCVLAMFITSFCASLRLYCEAFNSLVDWVLWQAVPDHLQCFFEFGDWFRFWTRACDRPPASHPRHGSPWVWRIWRPLILSDEFWAVDLKPFPCYVCLSLIAVVKKTQ